MTEENKWNEVSKDISDISNKIKDNLIDDESMNDLKETLSSAKDSIKKNFFEKSVGKCPEIAFKIGVILIILKN